MSFDVQAEADDIDVSVVITTRDRAEKLKATLDSLARQRIEGFRWEIVVIDNGSRDGTADLLEAASLRLPLRYFHFAPAGKCRAQNFAVTRVRGALVVFTDDDVRCDPEWAASLWKAAVRWPEADLFGGEIGVALVDAVPDWLAGEAGREIIDRHCARYRPRDREGYTDVPPIGPNMAIRRDTLSEVRFDEHVGPDGTTDYIKGGDTDINRLLMAEGHRCVFVPDARIVHHAYGEQLTLRAFFEGAYRRGRKNAYLNPRSVRPGLFGAPMALWLRLARQWLRFKSSARAKPLKRYRIGMKYFYRLGYLQQIRRR